MWDEITEPADPAHVAAVIGMAHGAEPLCGDTVVVAIDGTSGSGKTTLAHGVADALDAQLIHMDHIYPGWNGLAESVEILTELVLRPLAEGSPAAYRRWGWSRSEWADQHPVDPDAFLVVEGCGSSALPAGSYAAVRVFVDADRAQRLRRGLARDGEAYRPHWEQWAVQESALFERDRTRERADLLIDTTTV